MMALQNKVEEVTYPNMIAFRPKPATRRTPYFSVDKTPIGNPPVFPITKGA